MEGFDLVTPGLIESFEHASAEELSDAIEQLQAAESAFRRLKLAAIAVHDRRRLWEHDGCRSAAEWVKVRLATRWRTATETVRVANALEDLPEIGSLFASGGLSYDQICPLTEFATAETDEVWASEAQMRTPDALSRIAARERPEPDESITTKRSLKTRWDERARMLKFWGRLPPAEGRLFEAVIDHMAERVPTDPATGGLDPFDARRADALIDMARIGATYEIAESSDPSEAGAARRCEPRSRSDKPKGGDGASLVPRVRPPAATVIVHAQAEAVVGDGLAELERGPALGAEALRRLACDGSLQVVAEDPDGNPLKLGRRVRTVNWQLNRHLWHRDGGCAYPGCDRAALCEGHHVLYFARLGKTEPDNLLLLCWWHHRAVHECRFTIEAQGDERFRFLRPNGAEIRAAPAPLRPSLGPRIRRLAFGDTGPDEGDGPQGDQRTLDEPEAPDTS